MSKTKTTKAPKAAKINEADADWIARSKAVKDTSGKTFAFIADDDFDHLANNPDEVTAICGAAGSAAVAGDWPKDFFVCEACLAVAEKPAEAAPEAPELQPKSIIFPAKQDELLEEARKLVAEHGASASVLQKHLKIGYNRAADLISALQPATAVTAEAKTDTVKKHLECKVQLNDHDKAVYGLELANLNIEWGSIDSARKSAAKRYADELAGLDEDINRISSKLRDGHEHRGVECEVTYNTPKGGMKSCKRLDTGETFVETMTADELQPRLKFAEDSRAKGKEAATAETLIDGKAAYVCGCGMSFSPDAAGAYVRQGEAVKCPACVAQINEDVAPLGLAVVLTPPPDGVTGEDEVSPFATHCNET